MTTRPVPCPICSNRPEIDHGPSDAPFEIPLVSCATIFLEGPGGAPFDMGCPMYAQGVAAWNYLAARAAGSRRETTDA